MRNLLNRFAKDESGATAIEYGLIAALVAVVIIAGLSILGPRLSDTFEGIAGNLPGDDAGEGGGE